MSVDFKLSSNVHDLPRFRPSQDILVDKREAGAWAFICRETIFVQRIAEYFGCSVTKPLVIKVWQDPVHTNQLQDIRWSRYFNLLHEPALDAHDRGSLLDSLKAQNFAGLFNLAPRVHALFLLESYANTLHPAILTDDLTVSAGNDSSSPVDILRDVTKFCYEFGLQPPFGDLATPSNFIGGKLVDWQYSKPTQAHLDYIKKNYLENTQFGESKYQTAPVIGIDVGIRNTEGRLADLGLNTIEFRGKTILDIGCNGGQFLNYAASRGARYGCGVDWPAVASAANYVSNYLGNFNIAYYGHPLHEGFPSLAIMDEPFDLVLLLSMTTHIGTPDYLHSLGKRMIIEINHPEQVDGVLNAINDHWWYRHFGKAGDHGDRAIYHCYNKKYHLRRPQDLDKS